MTKRVMIALAGLALLLAALPALGDPGQKAEALINKVRATFEDPHFSRDAVTSALADALSASLLILPETDYAEDFRARVETVRKMFDDETLFSDKGRQYLGFAYMMVSGGKTWQVPEELKIPDAKKGIAKAREICAKLLDSSLAELKAGRNERAIRDLIDFVILVVTPIEV
ncbi:MAG TPA: hypothetical protein ENO03_08060 [Candidatus Aminicenantes bacterium]|nr:hypothetical protein [Candidatus Aminicenantes bacterium]